MAPDVFFCYRWLVVEEVIVMFVGQEHGTRRLLLLQMVSC